MKPKKLNQVTDFDIKLLKIFKTVCDCHSFTSAESILGISRSAISLHMSDLENRLGIRLCQRGRAGFALTDEGREILEYIEVLTAAIEDFRSKVNQMHNRLKGEFNIGIINNLVTMPRGYITNTLTQLAEEHAEVIINISMSTLSDIECRVLDNRLHAGVIPLVTPLSGLDYFDLYSESSFLYCGKNHPLFNHCSNINLNELTNVPDDVINDYNSFIKQCIISQLNVSTNCILILFRDKRLTQNIKNEILELNHQNPANVQIRIDKDNMNSLINFPKVLTLSLYVTSPRPDIG